MTSSSSPSRKALSNIGYIKSYLSDGLLSQVIFVPPAPLHPHIYNNGHICLDVRNHPIFIHCKRTKHRTGCLVRCLRKVQSWCLSSILEEYQKNASLKWRQRDLQFI